MLPSPIHAVLPPSLPDSPKRVHNVVRACDLSMDDFLRDVQRQFEAPLRPERLLQMSARLQDQFSQKLNSSSMCMLPSYNHSLPTGHESGTYLALDVGGSTFRVALVQLGSKRMELVTIFCFPINNAVRALEGAAFFDWMADRIADTLLDPQVQAHVDCATTLPMGVAWSFPIE